MPIEELIDTLINMVIPDEVLTLEDEVKSQLINDPSAYTPFELHIFHKSCDDMVTLLYQAW